MDNSVKGMLAIITIVVVIGGAFGISYMYNLQAHGPTQPSPSQREGFIAITVTELEPSTRAANAGASSAYTIWHLSNPSIFPISSKTDLYGSTAVPVSTATSFTIAKADNVAVSGGYKQYIVLQTYSGTADYLSMKDMISGNSGVVINHQENIDLGIDGYPEVLFLVDVTNWPLSPTAAVATPLPVTSYLTVLDNTLSDNSPADVNVAGAGAQSGSGVQNWQITVTTDNVGDSFVIGRIYLTFNDTETYLTPKALTVTAFDGTQTTVSVPGTENVGTTSYIYYYPPSGISYRWTYNGLMMYRSTGSNTFVNIAWAYDYSFAAAASGLATDVFLYWDVIGSTSNGGTITAYNDDVVIGNPS